jgi:arylsulfatase
VDGIEQRPIEGVPMNYSFDRANASAPSTRTTQYFEIMGNRAIYHDGWIACTTPPQPPWLMGLHELPDVVNGYKWELYHITEDYSENNDLAATMPGKVKEMQELFLAEAAKYDVLPLDNSVLPRVLSPKPSYTAGRTVFTYSGVLSGLPNTDAPNILGKSFTITAEVDIPQGGAEGVLVTDGGRFGGWGLYLLKGKPVFTYNLLALERFRWEGGNALSPGRHTVVFDFKYDGAGFGKGGAGALSVDGREVATRTVPHTIPFLATIDETFDVGTDTRTPVDDRDYQVPFPFTGKLVKLTVELK